MSKCYYVVDIIPHECYMGLPSEPEITVVIDKITTKFGFQVKSERAFDTCNRDLFKCVSECKKYFAEQKVDARHIQWPDFCRYADTLQLIKNDTMGLFNKKKEVEPKPYDILKAFQNESQKIADDFSEKFPVGTFVKEWFGNDEWNCSFCYISSDPYVDLDETTITNYNIEQYKKCKNNKDESCIYVNYIPINIYCLDNTCGNQLFNRFTLCESRHVVKSTFGEYREYMLNKFNENIIHHKEQIKRDREFIRDYKRRIRHIDSDLEKAIAILNANLEAEIKRNKK